MRKPWPLPDPCYPVGEVAFQKAAAGACAGGGVRIDAGEDVTGLPNGGVGIGGAYEEGVGPCVEAEQPGCQGGCDVHGAAVHADDCMGFPHEPDQLRQAGAVEQAGGVGRQGHSLHVGGLTAAG